MAAERYIITYGYMCSLSSLIGYSLDHARREAVRAVNRYNRNRKNKCKKLYLYSDKSMVVDGERLLMPMDDNIIDIYDVQLKEWIDNV